MQEFLHAGNIVMLLGSLATAFAQSTPWYFDAEQIDTAYRYQRNYGQRLPRPLNPQDCYYGKTEFPAYFRGQQFRASCRFIQHTTRHLKTMLERGMARYLFPLDAGHAHLLMPSDLWEREYSTLNSEQMLPRLLREPRLAVLYHSAEHLLLPEESESTDAQLKNWKAQRNIVGFYDGREPKVLPPHPDGSGYERVDGYQTVFTFVFLGHRHGAFFLTASGISHNFDLSFDDDLAVDTRAEISTADSYRTAASSTGMK